MHRGVGRRGATHAVVARPANPVSPSKLSHLTRLVPRKRTQMKHVAAYLLLVSAGNTSPSAEDVKKVLAAAESVPPFARASRFLCG